MSSAANSLYAIRRRPGAGFEVREIIKPPLTHESQPEDLNELLDYFLGSIDSYVRTTSKP